MNTTPKPFELKPEDIGYCVTPDNKRVRARVKLTRDGCREEVSTERDDPIAAVIAAIDKALERWFDEGAIVADQSFHKYRDSSYACTNLRMGPQQGIGVSKHPDIVKAVALSYVTAINEAIGAPTPA